ncbi:AAA family ATPase [Archaeoglobales archaeon]|nr:MAG: AAA family ATPase [Archaeoglobales archaeon]
MSELLSCPEEWAEFFEDYYKEEVNKIASEWANGIKKPMYVDVLKDLAIYREGKLLEELLNYPLEVIKHAEMGLAKTDNIYDVSLDGCRVRFVNLPTASRVGVRDVRSDHISKFVGVEGLIRKATAINPFATVVAFECRVCGNTMYKPVDFQPKAKLKPPYECKRCKSKGKFDHVYEKSTFKDTQIITIQDYPENLRGGEEPILINVFLREDLTGIVNPGDRVFINGIVHVIESDKALSQVYIEANSIEPIEKEYEEIDISDEEKKKIIELSKDPDIVDKIIKSIAPSIYGYEKIKEAIALQLFSGVPKTLADGTRKRGDIHILLVGDPGIAKSVVLRWVRNVAPRAVYTTGKGASSVGITASVTRDELSGRWTLDAGALVLADKGIAIVDEIDKMRSDDRSALHEALEQQTITINKAGINAILRARCSLLSAANPKYGRFDRFAPVAEQIDLSPTLLSRFDLIFTIFDKPDEKRDSEMADNIIATHMDVSHPSPVIEPDLLKKYIAYARRYVKPRLTKEASEEIKKYYIEMRSKSKENSSVSITPRQLEALIRLAEASARMRLSEAVEIEDAKRATKLVEVCLKEIALDPETGEVDIDYIFTGVPKTQRERILIVKKIIEELEDNYEKGVPEYEIIRMAGEQGIDESRIKEILKKLKEVGDVYSPKYDHYKLVVK